MHNVSDITRSACNGMGASGVATGNERTDRIYKNIL